jgi:hypothetical protein
MFEQVLQFNTIRPKLKYMLGSYLVAQLFQVNK